MDPYSILGVSRDASMDEVKKAYRKKARENHPDLNPDDPKAEERMNQVNEAYDRIMNPEKFAASDARKRGYSSTGGAQGGTQGAAGSGYYDPFAGWGSAGTGSQNAQGSGQPGQGSAGSGGAGQNPYVWTTVDFEDIFGGGWGAQQTSIHPEAIPSDSPEVRQAINNINSNNFKDAIYILQQVQSTGRDARWHYLFAIANNGAGNTVAAHDNIGKARQMDPGNIDYQRAESQFNRRAQAYTQQGQGRGFTTAGIDPTLLCCCICLAPSICSCFSRMFMYGNLGGWNI